MNSKLPPARRRRSAIGWELSKNEQPRRQLTYVIGGAALMVLVALVVNALVRLLD